MNHHHTNRPRAHQRRLARLGITATSLLALAACGSESKDAAAPTAPAATASASDVAAYCAVVKELNDSESFPPTADLLQRYRRVALDEIAPDVDLAVGRLVSSVDDPTAFFVAFADDEIEQALHRVDAYETATCGVEHDTGPGEGATTVLDANATRIDVTATDYAFAAPSTAPAGRASLVLVNNGKEAHFMGLSKLKPGVTMQEVMAAEDPSTVTDGSWGSDFAAPGGKDDEVLTLDLTPGTYALFCWVTGPTGQPHAMMGMQHEIVVS